MCRSHRAAPGRRATILGSGQLAAAMQLVSQQKDSARGWRVRQRKESGREFDMSGSIYTEAQKIRDFNKFGEVRVCAICKETFDFGSKSQGAWGKYCSKGCRDKSRKNLRRIHKDTYKASRRKKTGSLKREAVDRRYIFMRDGYRCQLCKRKTRPTLDVNHDLYPNMDHILPLAQGGNHTRDNLQCLCRACNITKRDQKAGDQLLLIG